MQTITARELFRLAQQHSQKDVAALRLPALGVAKRADCVMMCADDLMAFAGALGVTVVHGRRRTGERAPDSLSFDEAPAPLGFEGEGA